jgi:acetamidase/formamidase
MNKTKHINWIALFVLLGAVLGPAGSVTAQTTAHTHELKLTPDNVSWGPIDGYTKPVLQVASGDTVAVETAGDRVIDYLRFAGSPESEIPDSLKELASYAAAHGHSSSGSTGPIYVEGTEPGDILEIHILKFEFISPYGWTQIAPGTGTLQKEFPIFKSKILHYDTAVGTEEFAPGIALKLAPFWGDDWCGASFDAHAPEPAGYESKPL